ncbi:MAG: sulfotransferase [Acidobacteriota bacterium]
MNTVDTNYLTPVDIHWEDGLPVIEWCDFRDLAFTDPFFIQTYFRLCQQYPETTIVKTGIQALQRTIPEQGLSPTGFIFHMSRCGSTLVSRLLGSLSRVLALGEPDPILNLLEFPTEITYQQRVRWLRDLILTLGRPRRSSERFFLIKFTSFNLFELPLIRQAFPNTPWLFIYREPVAVMHSVLKKPTGFMRMKAQPAEADRYLGIGQDTITRISNEEYLARFLAQMCRFILEQVDQTCPQKVLLVDYARLPAAITSEIAPFLGIHLTEAEKCIMETLSRFYSKDPTGRQQFEPNVISEVGKSEELFAQANSWVSDPYQQLRKLDHQLCKTNSLLF